MRTTRLKLNWLVQGRPCAYTKGLTVAGLPNSFLISSVEESLNVTVHASFSFRTLDAESWPPSSPLLVTSISGLCENLFHTEQLRFEDAPHLLLSQAASAILRIQ